MVHFVGAGPGDPEYITIRGAKLIAGADVIIYAGSLVNPAILEQAKAGAEILDSAYMTLEDVIEKVSDAESKGLSVVRLHTGDPSVYGAIREQIDELERLGIEYDITPGVSSFSAAAATLSAEYTLPGVSQTLILTRIAGKTPVPESESIRDLARHQGSMSIFLSAGHIAKVQEELIQGGYSPDTPAAIVYKASWPEEKTIRCTIGELYQEAVKAGIDRTALILVGEFLGDEYDRSKLYDPSFTTGYREGADDEIDLGSTGIDRESSEEKNGTATEKKDAGIVVDYSEIACICFTDRGEETARRIADGIDMTVDRSGQPLKVAEWTDKHFENAKALIYVGAAGIAVRAIAGHISDKAHDPAVICIDEAGEHVIPILSGHIGGANDLARKIADLLGSEAVLTTASDVRDAFAVDSWAKDQGLIIKETDRIVDVSSKYLDDSAGGITISSEIPIDGESPESVEVLREGEVDRVKEVDVKIGTTLHLIPKILVLGIGCRRGMDADVIEKAFHELLREQRLFPEAFFAVASIDLKADEEGLLTFCDRRGLKLVTFSADELKALEGEFSSSPFVEEVTGVDNVCERSAVCATDGGRLIVKKTVINGVTLAVAQRDTRLKW